jgi:4-hydroxy-2-oxoheptanedioate aldolase
MLKNNFLKQKLEKGLPVIGTWSIIPSETTIDIISSTEIDFIIIDAEHGPISFEKAQTMCSICESNNVSPVMRIGSIDESNILRALDIGIHCLQIPNVKSVEDVERIINYSKYPPLGRRGFSPFTRAGNYSINNASKLSKNANNNTLLAINIEGAEAIRNIDSILEIDGLDIIFIGLYDISNYLGIPGEVNSKKVEKLLSEITNKINDKNKIAGTITTNKDDIKKYLNMGLKYIVHLVDCEILKSSYTNYINYFHEQKTK